MKTPIRFRLLPLLLSLIILVPAQSSFAEPGQKDHTAGGAGPRKEKPRFKSDELLIRFASVLSKGAKEDTLNRRGFKKIKEFPSLNLYQVKIRPDQTVEAARDELRNEPGVLYAEPNFMVTTQLEPNDPRFDELWAFKNTGQTGGTASADIDAPGAWDITVGSSDVVIAVIDTGIAYRHGDLAGNMWVNTAEVNGVAGVDDDGNGYVDDFHGVDTINNDSDPLDDNDHGTHIAGTIGAVGNNGIGIAGLNWDVRLMACKFIGADGSGSVADAIECLQYVQQMRSRGVNVVATNNSYGMSDYSQALGEAIDAQRDILFITAAGNSSQNVDRSPTYPAGYFLPNILPVEATDSIDQLAYFSNYGVQTVLVGAPGVDILSTVRNDNYGLMSGTSMATPHVTGLAALIKSYHTSANWAGIRNRILSGGEDVSSLTGTSVAGRRVTASGSVSCNNRPLLAAYKYSFTVGTANTLSAISINCESPQGPVTATPSIGETVTLNDDGVPPDLAAEDGIFTANWTPTAEVSELTFSSPAGTQTVTPPSLADLTVLSVSAPSQMNTGDTVNLSTVVKNAGREEAGIFIVGFYLSTDASIATTDTALGSAVLMLLGPEAERTVSVDATIPAYLSSGTYYVGTVADVMNLVDESDETNNTGVGSPVVITKVYPDLVMTSVSGPPTAETGRQITVLGNVKNQGQFKAGTLNVGFYLSADGQITTADIQLGRAILSSLGAGVEQTVAVTGTVPATLSGGKYFVGAIADSANTVVESNEGNNSLAGNSVDITKLYPDLSVSSVSGPSTGATGQTVPVTVTVQNGGPGDASSSYLYVYLSQDANITAADTRIGTSTVPAMAGNTFRTVTVSAAIPASLAAGTYYLGAIADALSMVPESNESNNALAGGTLLVSGGDLSVSSVSGPSTGVTGQTVPVTVTVQNGGSGGVSSSYLYVYLSKDANITAADTRIGTSTVPAMAGNTSRTVTVNGAIPASLAAGTYYLGATADALSMVPESNESNNALAGGTLLVSSP